MRAYRKLMDRSHGDLGRIIVMAQPARGRKLEALLRGAGYEVHRTPDDGDLVRLVARLRPHAVIVTLDIPWINVLDVVHPMFAGARSVPVLLLGEVEDDPRLGGYPRLPLEANAALLLAAIESLVGSSAAKSD
jgi:hypothetical protein